MINRQEITGLVLAGGAGRRVQGRDKGLLNWRGQSLVSHVIARMDRQVDRLLLSCNRNIEQYRALDLELLVDSRANFQGPLAGLEAAAASVHSEYVAICACDTPLVPTDLVARLLLPFATSEGKSLDISYADDGHHRHYLCALVRSRCLPSLTSYLDDGQRTVHGWYELHNTVAVDFSDTPEAFQNLNQLS